MERCWNPVLRLQRSTWRQSKGLLLIWSGVQTLLGWLRRWKRQGRSKSCGYRIARIFWRICKHSSFQPKYFQKILEKTLFVFESDFYEFWVCIPFDESIPAHFSKIRAEKQAQGITSNHELGKQQLKWFSVENIRHSVRQFNQLKETAAASKKPFDPLKRPLLCEQCVMRKHLVKKMVNAEASGLLEKLERGLLWIWKMKVYVIISNINQSLI